MAENLTQVTVGSGNQAQDPDIANFTRASTPQAPQQNTAPVAAADNTYAPAQAAEYTSPQAQMQQNDLPENLRVEAPTKPRFTIGKIVGIALGVATSIFVFNRLTLNSKVNQLKANTPLSTTGNVLFDSKTRSGVAPGRISEIINTAAKFSGVDISKSEDVFHGRLHKVAKNAHPESDVGNLIRSHIPHPASLTANTSVPKTNHGSITGLDLRGRNSPNGVIPTVGKGLFGIAGVGAWGVGKILKLAWLVGVDTGNVGWLGKDREAARFDKKHANTIEKEVNRFEDRVRHDIARQDKSDATKLGFVTHAKNGGLAVLAGSAVMGVTMAVEKFLNRRKEGRDMEQYTAQIEQAREEAMLNGRQRSY